MKRSLTLQSLALAWLFFSIPGFLRAQAQQAGAPDTILYNGKIVTLSDAGVNENLGTIGQALAIRGETILAVGNNAQIRAMAGPNTKSIDLKGREVVPGFGATHDHPMDWDTTNSYIVKKVISDDQHIERFINLPADQAMQEFPKVLNEAVSKAKPGMWIRIVMLYGSDYRWHDDIARLFGRQINKQMLDLAAPNNPVEVRGSFTQIVINQKAIDAVKAHYGDQYNKFTWNPYAGTDKNGVGGTNYRWLEQDVVYPTKDLQAIYREGLSWMGGYGVTINGSGLYTPGAVHAYNALDQRGEMAIRVPWSYQWRPRPDFWSDPYIPEFAAAMVGKGDNYLWLTGLWPSDNGAGCSTLPRLTPSQGGGGGGEGGGAGCHFDPGGENQVALCNMVKAGGRLAGIHTGGDKDIDFILDTIEKCSKDAGMTLDEIRAKRHVYDHLAMSPRPDQVQRLKNLGMMVGGWNFFIWEGGGTEVLKNYGEQAAQWVIPRKSIFDGGVHESIEIDRPLGTTNLTYFTVMYAGISRKDWDGNITAPQQAVNRIIMLKSATVSPAFYAKRENLLGSLQPGKLADFLVLDRDYLTVPEEDIKNVRVLMTVVGGKVIHLVPSLAREIGMQPTGAQVLLGEIASKW